ncbi:MAG: hypothetical protein WAW75_08095 [Gallionella sp.]
MSGPDLAPVLIVTYARLEHLKMTVTALRRNILADQTDLYVASDYQRADSDAGKVASVRSYLRSIDGFKSITIFEREKNLGAAENTFSALVIILNKHDRFILMEDDIVTAPGFLNFINEAFDRYGENGRVFSISGYCPPMHPPSSYQYDAFFLGRMSAWGCGFTKERYESVREITRNEFDDFSANKKLTQAFIKNGEDLLVMLKNVAYGSLEAWDVRCMYTQFMNDQYTLYPTKSLVQNIGFDGTGVHCGDTDRFNVVLSDMTTFRLPDDVVVDQRIVKANREFRAGPSNIRIFIWKIRSIVGKWLGIFKRYLKSIVSRLIQ